MGRKRTEEVCVAVINDKCYLVTLYRQISVTTQNFMVSSDDVAEALRRRTVIGVSSRRNFWKVPAARLVLDLAVLTDRTVRVLRGVGHPMTVWDALEVGLPVSASASFTRGAWCSDRRRLSTPRVGRRWWRVGA